MTSVWTWVSRHGGGVQRREDWVSLLGDLFPSWAVFLKEVRNPAGIRFWANFRGGEEEYEVGHDKDGYWAIPVEGGPPERLNPTQAEFLRLDLDLLIEEMRTGGRLEGAATRLDGGAHAYKLGHRSVEGHPVTVFLVPYLADLWAGATGRSFDVGSNNRSLALALVECPADVTEERRGELLGRRILLGELPIRDPWIVDFTELLTASSVGVHVQDVGALCGRRFVLVVDRAQQRAWIEGQEIPLRAGSQSFMLLSGLAAKPGVAVTNLDIANTMLESDAKKSFEGKIVDGAKAQLTKQLDKALRLVTKPRVQAKKLIVSDGGRQSLALSADLIFVRE
jgi:hypothetical protein